MLGLFDVGFSRFFGALDDYNDLKFVVFVRLECGVRPCLNCFWWFSFMICLLCYPFE